MPAAVASSLRACLACIHARPSGTSASSGPSGSSSVHQRHRQVSLEVGVEQQVLVGDAVPKGMLAVPDQRPGTGRQSPLHVGNLVVICPPEPVEQLGVPHREQTLVVERLGAPGSTACAAGGRGHAGWPSTGAPGERLLELGPANGTSQPCGPAYRPRRRGSGGGGGTGVAPVSAPGNCRGRAGRRRSHRRPGPVARLPLPDPCAANVETCLRSSGCSHCGHWSGCRPLRTMASKRWPQWSQRYSKMGTMGPL